MRKRFAQQFEQQLELGTIPIGETRITTQKSSGPYPALCAALKEIFITPEWNERVFEILESKIMSGKKRTGRLGMDLWQIYVLAQVRLLKNLSYEDLHHISNNDHLIRQIMGIERGLGYERRELKYQNIIDNVSLLDDDTVRELNHVIVEFGHEVFKKKEVEALRLKTDSFVVESNVHFPTDYNLIWDSGRKGLDIIAKFLEKYPEEIEGWRKIHDWYRRMKNAMRALGKASSSGGKNKEERIKKAVRTHLSIARMVHDKLENTELPIKDKMDIALHAGLFRYLEFLEKFIDQLDRRILKGEKIPHQEKVFSIFEEYTEWITKGKQHPNVELGKMLAITTDQYHLIVDYRIMEHQSDSEMVKPIAEDMTQRYDIRSWSFDKGYWHKDNKALLEKHVEKVVMPKKGKPNKQEAEEESSRQFKILRNKHSAVESNINELEHRGLDRCPDRGYMHFKRYIGLAVAAYNLRRIGQELIEIRRKRELAERELKVAA
ncbi:MAG TPA: ISNCY family transposase [Epsilonproteobacteria bacterium]|nr:ISNCY family transposase [Campylobacterota bacterium]